MSTFTYSFLYFKQLYSLIFVQYINFFYISNFILIELYVIVYISCHTIIMQALYILMKKAHLRQRSISAANALHSTNPV